MPKKPSAPVVLPTEAELAAMDAEAYESNTALLDTARTLTIEAFGQNPPDASATFRTMAVIDDGCPPEIFVSLMEAAKREAAKYGITDNEDLFDVFDILADDADDGAKHLADAAQKAKAFASQDAETILGIYSHFYGYDEEEGGE